MMQLRLVVAMLTGLAGTLAACGSPPPEVDVQTDGQSNTGSTGPAASSSDTTVSPSSTGPAADTSGGPGSTTDASSSGSTGALDATGSSSEGTTAALEDGSSSREGTTGEVSSVGCADGEREALVDEVQFPHVAACAGGFWIPGVAAVPPLCDRQGGDDGPLSDGMGCSIEDLCAEGWHLCTSRQQVMAAGLGSCAGQAWNGQFFATSQSGEGSNTCADTGTNDVFGCGDVGYAMVSDCAPLNRSTGNLCVSVPGAWSCSEDAYDEVSHLVKPGPDAGGALCCRDGV